MKLLLLIVCGCIHCVVAAPNPNLKVDGHICELIKESGDVVAKSSCEGTQECIPSDRVITSGSHHLKMSFCKSRNSSPNDLILVLLDGSCWAKYGGIEYYYTDCVDDDGCTLGPVTLRYMLTDITCKFCKDEEYKDMSDWIKVFNKILDNAYYDDTAITYEH